MAPIAVGLGLALTACGGGQTKNKTSTSPTVAHGTTPEQPVRAARTLSETVRSQTSTSFTAVATATAGQSVFFRTVVPGTPQSPAKLVQLRISRGPGRSLTVAATSGHRTSVARLTTASGKTLTLVRVHYPCALPPAPSFCPARRATASKRAYRLRFSTVPTAPVLVQAMVGPVKSPPLVVHHAGTSVVPAYTPTELVQGATPPPAGSPPGTRPRSSPPGPTATVKPHDAVVMITHLAGRLVGATQGVTVTINQGPGHSVTVAAKVAGGPTSTATVKSATAVPITLLLPHYLCFAPPDHTFCPPRRVLAAGHRYHVTFLASPYTPPLVFIATAGAG